MSLHRGRQVLYLCHGNCASERSEVPLNLPKNPLCLSCWEVPYHCCSPGSGSCSLWPWAVPVPCKIGRSHGSHICTQHNVHPSKTLLYKNMIYISKRHKNYICKQKTVQVETYPSPLAPHQEALVSLDLWKNRSLHMGNPQSLGSAMTTRQKSRH